MNKSNIDNSNIDALIRFKKKCIQKHIGVRYQNIMNISTCNKNECEKYFSQKTKLFEISPMTVYLVSLHA